MGGSTDQLHRLEQRLAGGLTDHPTSRARKTSFGAFFPLTFVGLLRAHHAVALPPIAKARFSLRQRNQSERLSISLQLFFSVSKFHSNRRASEHTALLGWLHQWMACVFFGASRRGISPCWHPKNKIRIMTRCRSDRCYDFTQSSEGIDTIQTAMNILQSYK